MARAAARVAIPVVAVAGRRSLTGEQLRRARIQAAYALTDIEPDIERCISQAGLLLEQLTVAIADEWLPRCSPAVHPAERTATAGDRRRGARRLGAARRVKRGLVPDGGSRPKNHEVMPHIADRLTPCQQVA